VASLCRIVFRPRSGHEGPGAEYVCSSTLSLTSALDGRGWLTLRPGRVIPGKETRYPLYRRLRGTQGPVWTAAEDLAPTGIRSPAVQPVPSRCTD
jgi:hypothetical protein